MSMVWEKHAPMMVPQQALILCEQLGERGAKNRQLSM